MRKILFLVLFIAFCSSANAQISKMFFGTIGMSILSDINVSSSTLITDETTNFSTTYQHLQWNYVSFHVGGRMNIANLSDNAGLSIRTIPTIGIGVAYSVFDGGSWYSTDLTIPLFLELNLGLTSRYSAPGIRGMVVGVGIEQHMAPLYAYAISETNIEYTDYQKSWATPVCEVGYRYMNDKNIVKEINLKAGLGQEGKDFVNFDSDYKKEKRPISVRLSFSRILNY